MIHAACGVAHTKKRSNECIKYRSVLVDCVHELMPVISPFVLPRALKMNPKTEQLC